MNKERVIGGYDSMREGTKGAKLIYCILFTHLGTNWKSDYMSFMGNQCSGLLHANM